MASFVPSQPGRLIPARSYSAEAWEQKRMIISQLYRDEARSLNDVLVLLAQEHDFRPTPAMLKKRIAKWSLDRKRKQPDMLAALRLSSERKAQGKETIFWIRGRLVTFRDVKQYFRRKGTRDLQSLIATANTTTPSTHIDCRTPEPDLVAVNTNIHNLEASPDPTDSTELATHESFDIGEAISPIVALSFFNQVDPVMPLNATMSQLEQLLHLSRTYYDSVFEKPHWRNMDSMFQLRLLERFYHRMLDGQTLLERDHIAEAFQHFDLAFDMIRDLMNREILLFLPYLYHMMLAFRKIQRQEVFSRLLGFAHQMGQTRFPQRHPLHRSITILHHMSIDDRVASSECSLWSIVDRLRVEFEAYGLDDLDPGQDDICSLGRQLHTISPVHPVQDAHKLTSIAVWKFVNESGILKSSSLKRPKPSKFELENVRSLDVGTPVDPVYLRRSPDGSSSLHKRYNQHFLSCHGWHGDLKPENVLPFMTGQQQTPPIWKIGDFASATAIKYSAWRPEREQGGTVTEQPGKAHGGGEDAWGDVGIEPSCGAARPEKTGVD